MNPLEKLKHAETEVRETLELFSRYEITDPKTLQNIGKLIEKAIRDKNTEVSEAIAYLLVARKLNTPNLEDIVSVFYYNDYPKYLIDMYLEILKRNGTIEEQEP